MRLEPDFYVALANVVKEHRKQAGLSQKSLAEYAGVGKTVIYDIEHKKESVKLSTVLKVLAALNIEIQLKSPMTK